MNCSPNFRHTAPKTSLTTHSIARQIERRLPEHLAEMAMYFGEECTRAGAQRLRITSASVAAAWRCGVDLSDYLDACMIVNRGTFITCYRRPPQCH